MTDSKFLPINGNHREEDKFRTGQNGPFREGGLFMEGGYFGTFTVVSFSH